MSWPAPEEFARLFKRQPDFLIIFMSTISLVCLALIALILSSCYGQKTSVAQLTALKPYEWMDWRQVIEQHGFYVACLGLYDAHTLLKTVPTDVTECDVVDKRNGQPAFGEPTLVQETSKSRFRLQVYGWCNKELSKPEFDAAIRDWKAHDFPHPQCRK